MPEHGLSLCYSKCWINITLWSHCTNAAEHSCNAAVTWCVIQCHKCHDMLWHTVTCQSVSLTPTQLHTNTNALLNSNVWKSPTVINPESLRQIARLFVGSHQRRNKQTQAIGPCSRWFVNAYFLRLYER